MAETITIARPYAEAVFKLAREHNTLARWSEMLALASTVVGTPDMQECIQNPRLTTRQVGELFLGICGERLSGEGRNFVLLLIENKRVRWLPQIRELYEALKAEHEGVLEATLYSAFALDEGQRQALIQTLEEHFKRKVEARVVVDPELIGGVKIVVGDEVIDTSVRGKLEAMTAALDPYISRGSRMIAPVLGLTGIGMMRGSWPPP